MKFMRVMNCVGILIYINTLLLSFVFLISVRGARMCRATDFYSTSSKISNK